MKTLSRFQPKFTLQDALAAHELWGCNCGPSSVAAIYGLTLDEARPHLHDFEQKRYTNPTLMWSILNSLGKPWHHRKPMDWPAWGLVRIQWHGPWMNEGVPMAARYRQTHWVGAARGQGRVGVWDVNALSNGQGWTALENWIGGMVPYITKHIPKADGNWSITHAVEVKP